MRGLQPSRRVSANYTAMGTERAGMKEKHRVACRDGGTTLPRMVHSFSVTARFSFRPLSPVAYRAFIRALLLALPPPYVIFAPGRRPAVLVRLQTAAHIRLPSTVQEEQGATAPCDRTRIVRFTVCEQVEAVALRFAHHRRRIFSVLLPHNLASRGGPLAPSRPNVRG